MPYRYACDGGKLLTPNNPRIMLKAFTFVLLSLAALTSVTAQPTRLVGYEEISLDTLGVINHYIAHWNKFSNNRGSALSTFNHVGWNYPEMIMEESACDTTHAIESRGYGAYKDSSMTVRKYAHPNNNLLESITYKWNYPTAAWRPYMKDSFSYVSGQMMTHHWFQYDTMAATFNYYGNEEYAYNSSGKLILTMRKHPMPPPTNMLESKHEYIWSGNQLTEEKGYFLGPSSTWLIQYQYTTVYNNNNPIRQEHKRWGYLNMVTATDSIIDYDSNIYNGNDLAWRYHRISSYPTSIHPFNFRRHYVHDTKGNITEVEYDMIDIAGVWHNFRKYEISFNGINNPTLAKEYDWDSTTNGWRLAWRGNPTYKYYHYEKFPTTVPTICKTGAMLYPSPAQHTVHVQTPFDKETVCSFAIFDMQGRLLRQWSEPAHGGEDVAIPISTLPDGNYLLRLSAQGETTVHRFSVEK